MKVLIIGDGNSIHIVNFIKALFQGEKIDLTILNISSYSEIREVFQDFYKENNIKIISINKNNLFSSLKFIPKLKGVIYSIQFHKKLRSLGTYDYCLIHYIDELKARNITKNKGLYKYIVPVFWGSDLLRSNINKSSYLKLFSVSRKIIFNTSYMKENFVNQVGTKYKSKLKVIKFPVMSFDLLEKINSIDQKAKINSNKNIIMCGHSGSASEHHEEVIESISKIDKDILKKCYFIFPMTYSSDDSRNEKIRKLLLDKKIDGEVITKYLSIDDMLGWIKISDIYINVIETDAFSGVMQEHIYSGSLVINGSWLKYPELDEEGIITFEVSRISEITSLITELLNNVEKKKEDIQLRNRKGILKISSPSSIKNSWFKDVLNQK